MSYLGILLRFSPFGGNLLSWGSSRRLQSKFYISVVHGPIWMKVCQNMQHQHHQKTRVGSIKGPGNLGQRSNEKFYISVVLSPIWMILTSVHIIIYNWNYRLIQIKSRGRRGQWSHLYNNIIYSISVIATLFHCYRIILCLFYHPSPDNDGYLNQFFNMSHPEGHLTS